MIFPNGLILGGDPFAYVPASADWLRIMPELIILGTALVVLLADLIGASTRKGWLALVGLLGVIAAAAVVGMLFASGHYATAFYGMVSDDPLALLADMVVLAAAAAGLLLSPGYTERQGITHVGEYYALLLLSTLGMMLMASATNLMIVFVGLEMLSLALYILCAIIPLRRSSQEAGMKYFILSSFASAFLLYGMALTYGSTGTTSLAGMRAFLGTHPAQGSTSFGPLLFAGLGLMAVGFSFKVAAVPFQAWTPDVYVGAPTSVTAFMSVGTKVAAFVALARIFLFALAGVYSLWMPVFWAIAVLTMVVGNMFAITQRDVKRMLAYSSVANAGYMLIAVAVGTQVAVAGLMTYLVAYAVMNLGAFGVVLVIERDDGRGTTLDEFAGLARHRPWLAAAMALFLFALAGVPLTSGFIGKWYVFYAAIIAGHAELAVVGVLASVLGMFYYLRVIWAMYFSEPVAPPALAVAALPTGPTASPLARVAAEGRSTPGAVAVAAPAVAPAGAVPLPLASPVAASPAGAALTVGTWLTVTLAAIGTVAIGILPGGIVALAQHAAAVLFH